MESMDPDSFDDICKSAEILADVIDSDVIDNVLDDLEDISEKDSADVIKESAELEKPASPMVSSSEDKNPKEKGIPADVDIDISSEKAASDENAMEIDEPPEGEQIQPRYEITKESIALDDQVVDDDQQMIEEKDPKSTEPLEEDAKKSSLITQEKIPENDTVKTKPGLTLIDNENTNIKSPKDVSESDIIPKTVPILTEEAAVQEEPAAASSTISEVQEEPVPKTITESVEKPTVSEHDDKSEEPPQIIELIDDEDESVAETSKENATESEAEVPEPMDTSDIKDSAISEDIKEEEEKKPAKKESEVNEKINVTVQRYSLRSEGQTTRKRYCSDDEVKNIDIVPKEEPIYHGKECINYDCERKNNDYIKAPQFISSFYQIPRKTNKVQYVCDNCFDKAVVKYQDLCSALQSLEPLLEQNIPKRQDFVEILDSSDEEEDNHDKVKEEPEIEKETIDMLQKDLDDTICDILSRVEIENQVGWTNSILRNKLDKLEEDSKEISKSLKMLQKSADKMHTSLYQCPKIKIKELQPLDLNTGRPFVCETEYTIPPIGELTFSKIEVNGLYYAVKNKAIASWLPCRVIEFVDVIIAGQKTKYYKVKFIRMKVPTIKCVSPKHMAYGDPPKVRLQIGTRVIALFDCSTLTRSKDKTIVARSAFYPGIIAEQLQAYNKYRYLIFFDDGYAQYVQHKDIRVVCHASENVWEDIHPASREFIHNYLSQYQKHRPMVQVKKGQSMITESNGKWLYAKVVDIDASLVQMYFDGQNRSEWIYRGSTRLGPLFREKQTRRTTPVSNLQRRSEPYVRYMQEEDTANKSEMQSAANQNEKQSGRAVAKKSTSRQDSQSSVPVKHLNNSTIFLEDDNRPKGKVVYYTAKKNMPPKQFVPHQCNPKCLFQITHNLSSYSPLAKPLLSGWERQIFKNKLKKSVVYRAPCGRRLRNMDELHKYLRLTKNVLNVDNFDFDCVIHCLAEYVIDSHIVQKTDLSDGVENMIIPCINYYDNTMPPECVYSKERIPTDGVNLNLDPNFLCGCDCEDDCSDKTKCSCWQLTLSGARFGNPNTLPENVGYSYKRLPDPVPTGIYECNSNCKCSRSCLNRVVQHQLQTKLQVFKTSNRGWGLRCLNDVPKGSFICIYAGHLLTEQTANEGGANFGDEYFAELDYIEVVERLKEGYESDVQEDPDSDEEIEEPAADSDEDFRSTAIINKDASINTRLRARRSTRDDDSKDKKRNSDDEDDEDNENDKGTNSQERQVINFEANTALSNEDNTTGKYRSIRKYYGKNEYCYIMDAKTTGNIGRYFNHSCSPNLFVQNVFVDTHDLRFPWVAFFALSHIRAGTELTWNYNYEVGIVPGKVLYCECGAPNCRGRLL